VGGAGVRKEKKQTGRRGSRADGMKGGQANCGGRARKKVKAEEEKTGKGRRRRP
jgi:hypothetical protein